MRLDTANRSFFTLVAIALGPYLLLGVFACGALSTAVYDLVVRGPAAVPASPVGWAALGFLAVAAVGALAALRSLYRQAAATRHLGRFVAARRIAPTEPLVDAVARTGISRVDLVETDEPYAFSFRMLAPRVVVSTALVSAATARELDAVLLHERYHVANLDPLKTVVARVIPTAFFFLPALAHLRQRYLAGRELAADRRAVRVTGHTAMAAVLYKTATAPSPPLLHTATAIGGNELLEVRIAQLEAGHEPALAAIPPRTLTLTGFGLLATAAGLTVTIAAGGATMAPPSVSLDLLGGLACGALWLAGAAVAYRRFAIRHH